MKIEEARKSIKETDLEICRLVAERIALVIQIGMLKKEQGIEVVDEVQKEKNKEFYRQMLGGYGEAIYETIHEISVTIQKQI